MSQPGPIEHPSWLTSGDFTQAEEPFVLFSAWLKEATASEPRDPTAMTLATIGADGLPNARIVLLKGVDERGFVFYTNTTSQKGRELGAAKTAALVFYWKSLNRQVRVRGTVEPVTPAEADAYFASRARGAQVGAWASQQSQPLESRKVFEQAVADTTAKFGDAPVPRPPHWSGYRVVPKQIEFWQDRPFRLHDRIVFARDAADKAWRKTRLYP
jgi:pyridoxamine 5'-phosphate oxidase